MSYKVYAWATLGLLHIYTHKYILSICTSLQKSAKRALALFVNTVENIVLRSMIILHLYFCNMTIRDMAQRCSSSKSVVSIVVVRAFDGLSFAMHHRHWLRTGLSLVPFECQGA